MQSLEEAVKISRRYSFEKANMPAQRHTADMETDKFKLNTHNEYLVSGAIFALGDTKKYRQLRYFYFILFISIKVLEL